MFWMLSICSSTSFMDIRPRKPAATVRNHQCLGSQAVIMFLASNICCVNSDTERALYCWEPLDKGHINDRKIIVVLSTYLDVSNS